MEALSSRSTPPPKDIEQDVDVRRSRRAGRGSAKKTAMKVYRGSGTKQRARRSFRTPIQTIPLQGAETSEKSASRSFAMMPDQEDIFTPRSNIEGFLASAVEQPGPDNTTPDMPKMTEASSSDTTVFKIPDQPDGFASRRTQASSDPALTPDSKFTPRTNVFNWIHCLEEPEHTPIVRGYDLVNQPSSETRESITKHQEWGQEISLSPIYLSRTSEGKDDSPSTLTQAFKRVRRSFHIPVSQAMVMASQVATEQSLAATEENPVLVHASDSDDADPVVRKRLEEARESLFEKFGSNGDFGLELGLSAAESENLGLEVGLSAAESGNLGFFVSQHLKGISASTLENLNAEVDTDLEERPISVLEDLNAEVGTDLEGRPISVLEDLNAEVGTDLEGRPISVLEDLNAEVGTDLEGRHISDFERLNAEVGTDLEERHLSDLENLNAEVGTDLEERHLSDLENLNAEVGTDLEESHLSDLENLNAEVGTDLEERHLSDLENLNPEVGTDLEERHLSDLENLNSEVGTDLEERHLSDLEKASSEALSEKLDFFLQADLGMPSCVVSENLDAFVNGEDEDNNPDDIEDDQQMAADDETIQTEAAENVIHEKMTAAKDLMSDEDNVNNMLNVEDEDNLNNMLNVEGTEAVAENRNGEEDGRFVMSKYSRCQLNMASEATLGVNAVNETGHVENAASNVLGQDFETILTSTPCSANMDVDANTEENNTCGARVESVEGKGDQGSEMTGDAGVRHGELRKEKSFGSSRTSLTSKHGKITCSSSPKRTLKSTPAASAATPSVYDLSESSSSSSGDVRITKQRSSTPRKLTDNSKSLRKRGIGSAKSSKQNISPGRGSASRSKSKLSYSEWKSQQKGKGSPSRTMASFLDTRYPLSSTPSDRSKKIFHSTKIHHSVHADGDPVLETQMTDSIPNISPIRPVARSDAEKQISSGRGVADASTDRDDQGGVEEGSARIPHRESVLVNQDEQMAELDEDSSDAVLPGFSPLATPYIDMNRKSQKSVAGQTSAQKPLPQPQTSGFGREPRKETEAARQPPRKRTKTTSDTALPRRSVKFFAERHSTMKLSKDAVEEIERVSEIFWDNTFKALETFALHAGRKTVKDEDVVLLMKTQGLIKDTEDLHDAIRQFLPMELRSELIPMAKP